MARAGKIKVGDIGTQFIATVRDTQLDPTTGQFIHPVLDISTAVAMTMIWTKPDGTTITRTMSTTEAVSLFTNGQDGKMQFTNKKASVTEASFAIDQGDDYWQVMGTVRLANGREFNTDQYKFYVRNKE
jgi:hypothetical protein